MANESVKKDDLEIIDDKEYERALEALNNSKSSRVKKIKESKKKPAKAAAETSMDPVIPICLTLAFLAIAGAVIYFVLPVAVNPAMDVTYPEFVESFTNSQINREFLSSYDLDVDDVKYITSNTETGENITFAITDNSHYLDYFEKLVNSHFGAAVQGKSRKFDGKLTFLRAIVEYDDRISNFSFMTLYYANFLNSVYKELPPEDCINMASTVLKNYDGSGNYTVYGDYGYRVVYGADTANNIAYFALEIVPAKTL